MTTKINYSKILLSLATIGFVAALIVGATGAFFSDTETSQANTFTSGAIDLTVDSQAHYAGLFCNENGVWEVENPNEGTTREDLVEKECDGTWEATNLGPTLKFFSLEDIKPGDEGENTISLHVDSNDSYMCAIIDNLSDNDLGLTEPEQADGDTTDGVGNGELAPELHFFAWADNDDQVGTPGDNIWNGDEPMLFSNEEGPASDVLDGVVYPLFTPQTTAFPGGETTYVGLYWCYGDITVDAENHTLSCDGASVTNVSQTDQLTADISFYVEQARNNENFECPRLDNGGETDGDVVVSLNSLNGWQAYDDQFVGAGTTTFVPDATAPFGTGALRLETVGNDSRVGLFNDGFNFDLDGLQLSYDSKQVSATDVVNGNATVRLWIDTTGDNVADDQLMYEPYYNLNAENPLNAPSIVQGIWQTWSLNNTNGKLWSNNTLTYNGKGGVGAGSYASNFTIDDVLAVFPNAKVVGISISMGTYNPDQVVLVDNLLLNGTTYDFEN